MTDLPSRLLAEATAAAAAASAARSSDEALPHPVLTGSPGGVTRPEALPPSPPVLPSVEALAESLRDRPSAAAPETIEPTADSPRLPSDGRRRWARRKGKTLVSISLDRDLVMALKAGGRGWQHRLNSALRRGLGI